MKFLSEMFSCLCERPDEELLTKLFAAHRFAAFGNANASSTAASVAFVGSGDMGKAIIAGIATLGYLHAPIQQAREVLSTYTDDDVKACVSCGQHLPGWGNSFFKDKVDPAFADLYQTCLDRPSFARVSAITQILYENGANVAPNAALLTAYCCEEMGWAPGAEVVLFIVARAPIWAGLGLKCAAENPTLG